VAHKDVDSEAVYTVQEIQQVLRTARTIGTLAFTLTAWCYEFGARTAEPGQQLLRDVDLPNNRARPTHLKGGASKAWQFLMPNCQAALPLWLAERETHISQPTQALYLFPARKPGKCLTCEGTGQRAKQMRDGERRFKGPRVPCHHCAATGKRWGMDRREVYAIVAPVLRAAGMQKGRQHPHVLRHSVITHMLDAGVAPKVIQERVGHRSLQTTLDYVKATDAGRAEVMGKMNALFAKQ